MHNMEASQQQGPLIDWALHAVLPQAQSRCDIVSLLLHGQGHSLGPHKIPNMLWQVYMDRLRGAVGRL